MMVQFHVFNPFKSSRDTIKLKNEKDI